MCTKLATDRRHLNIDCRVVRRVLKHPATRKDRSTKGTKNAGVGEAPSVGMSVGSRGALALGGPRNPHLGAYGAHREILLKKRKYGKAAVPPDVGAKLRNVGLPRTARETL